MLVSDKRYSQLPLLPTYSGAKYNEIPVRVNLKKYCPVPGDQRQTGSCVGWAVGYGIFTIQWAILNNTTDQARITQEANSAAFIYNQVRRSQTDCTDGAYLEDALTLLKEQGDCLEKTFNYERYSCLDRPGSDEVTEALGYRAQDFAAVFALDEDPKAKVGKACKILATKTPIVVGIGVTKSFFEVLPGAVFWNPEDAEPIVGYHALVVTGYNSVEKYFDLLNSFGPSWGQNGFVRLAYDDFERLCRYAFIIVPDATALPNPTPANAATDQPKAVRHSLSGEFVFRRPAGFVTTEQGDELMYFEEVETRLEDAEAGLYTTAQSSFRVGDVFQLVARDVPGGRYIYVFGWTNRHTKPAFPQKKRCDCFGRLYP
ncbi:MAG: C1 family peptidase [Lewinellaceae bacterium]|nr:C1 family peptidase [Lewinellaceae bacterium]